MAEAFEVTALARHIPISAQKVRKVIDVVRGKDADQAMDILRFMPQKAAEPVYNISVVLAEREVVDYEV
jgi:large subunit ribosomal protein L22